MNKKEQKMFSCMKSFLAITLTMLLVVSIFPITAKAAESMKWTALGNGVYQLEGTQVKVEVTPGAVHVTGTGAIPDYDYWELNKRPWSTCECQNVTVDDTITSIGAYVFYDLPKLKYISISSKTFITDDTTFYKIDVNPIIRINGSDVTTQMIGTIPYTSMDSIKSLAQSSGTGRAYILDNSSLASAFQGSTNPTIQNVYSAADSEAPWNDLVTNWNGNVYKSICKITSLPPVPSYLVNGTRRYQGKAAYQAYAAFIADSTFATTFNITVTTNDANKTVITKTNTPYQYTLTIPEEFRKAGRSFRLLGIGQTAVYTYDDLDTNGDTITFTTDYPTTSYALVYKDM